jgi:hypothetical protein
VRGGKMPEVAFMARKNHIKTALARIQVTFAL